MRHTLIILLLALGLTCQAQIPQDKRMHIYAGALASGWGSTLHVPQSELLMPALKGMGVAAGVGVTKELFDLAGGGTAEWGDIGATMIGAVGSQLVIIGGKVLIKRRRLKRRNKHPYINYEFKI